MTSHCELLVSEEILVVVNHQQVLKTWMKTVVKLVFPAPPLDSWLVLQFAADIYKKHFQRQNLENTYLVFPPSLDMKAGKSPSVPSVHLLSPCLWIVRCSQSAAALPACLFLALCLPTKRLKKNTDLEGGAGGTEENCKEWKKIAAYSRLQIPESHWWWFRSPNFCALLLETGFSEPQIWTRDITQISDNLMIPCLLSVSNKFVCDVALVAKRDLQVKLKVKQTLGHRFALEICKLRFFSVFVCQI